MPSIGFHLRYKPNAVFYRSPIFSIVHPRQFLILSPTAMYDLLAPRSHSHLHFQVKSGFSIPSHLSPILQPDKFVFIVLWSDLSLFFSYNLPRPRYSSYTVGKLSLIPFFSLYGSYPLRLAAPIKGTLPPPRNHSALLDPLANRPPSNHW